MFESSCNFNLVAAKFVAAEPIETYVTYVDDGVYPTLGEESAGKIGKWLGIIAAVVIPFAAPAVFGAIASSGVLGSGLASAAAAGTIGTVTNVIGSAAVGALMQAGAAYAGGARGGDVWKAAGMGALSGGLGGLSKGLTAAAAKTTGAQALAQAPAAVSAQVPQITNAAQSVTQVAGGLAPAAQQTSVIGRITAMFGNQSPETLRRIGATLINAAVNSTDMGRMNGLVAEQRAALKALRTSNKAVYEQRIAEAQKILQQADQMDPQWYARAAMADVAGMEQTAFAQTMRNIATRQGGSLDSGQRKAYERSASLHTARSKALAYNEKFGQAQSAQAQLRATGVGLLGPDDAGMTVWQQDTELRAAQERANRDSRAQIAGGFAGLMLEHDYKPSVSPDPTVDENGPFNSNWGG